MDTKLFFENFDALAEAPGGVPKLRELILQLAVRGKLVEQDEEDGTGMDLLSSIKENKLERLGKKYKQLDIIGTSEIPFLVPDNWAWTRLGDFTHRIGSGSTPRGGQSAYVEQGIPFFRSQNIWNDGIRLSNVAFISEEVHEKMKNTKVYANDILLNITGASLGRVALVPDDFDEANVSQHVSIIRTVEEETRKYLHVLIQSPYCQAMIWGRQVGMAREGLSKKVLELFEIPVPPLNEQKRIVAKVDELMARCDELEEKQNKARECRVALNKSALHSLTSASNANDFSKSWRRVRDAFDFLYDTPETINDLRQAILELAITGKLVKQNDHENVEGLVDKIYKEKVQVDYKGVKKILPIEDHGILIPKNWNVFCFGDLTINRDPQRIPLSKVERALRKGDFDYYGASGVIDHIDDFIYDKDLLLIGEDGANLITRSKPIAFIARGKYWVNNHAHVLDTINGTLMKYLELYINAIDLKPYVTGSAQPKMNQAKMNSIQVALPPLKEQKRILEQVDKLISFCGKLQEQNSLIQSHSNHLLNSIVDKILES